MRIKSLFYLLIIVLVTIIPDSTAASNKAPTGTKVGKILVENKKEAEVRSLIEEEIEKWQTQEEILFEGEFESLSVSPEVVQFNIDLTLSELKDKTKRKLSTFFKRPKNVYIPLVVSVDESHADIQKIKEKTYINDEAVMEQLKTVAENLEIKTLSLPYVDGEEIPLENIAEITLEKPKLSSATIDYMIDELDGLLLETDEVFSFLNELESPDMIINSHEELSFIGTGLYGLFLHANFEIVTRHPQLNLPDYSEVGINAAVSKKDKQDLVAINDNETPYILNIKQKKKQVTFTLKGAEPIYTYEVEVEAEKEIKPRTIYRYSKRITPGEHEVVQPGVDGLSVDVVRSTFEKGKFMGKSVVSKDLYLPKPLILLVSPADPEVDENQVEINLDGEGDLFDEEIKIDREGNIIREDGSKGGSIIDLLPDNLEGTAEQNIVDQIIEVDKQQQQYEEFLDKLLDIYANSLDGIEPEQLEKMEDLKKEINQLEKTIDELIKQLIEAGVIDESDFKIGESEGKK